LGSIGSLDTAAIQNSYPARHLGISCCQLRTNSRMHFLGLLRRRGQPGTYGPDRLIRHHGPSKGLHPQRLDHGAQLGGNHLESPVRLTLLKRLADTEQRYQTAGLSRSELSTDLLVTLAEQQATLRVPNQNHATADIDQLTRSDLTGQRALQG